MVLKLGIDEAGRGPVIGPLIIAGCLIDEKFEEELKNLGVKDSKKLTRKKREELELEIDSD
jgi:ribonuclease HII